jgi:hypothetical protein
MFGFKNRLKVSNRAGAVVASTLPELRGFVLGPQAVVAVDREGL